MVKEGTYSIKKNTSGRFTIYTWTLSLIQSNANIDPKGLKKKKTT